MTALIRLVFAVAGGFAVTSAVFSFLHTLVSAQVDMAALQPAVRIEFGRLRRDSDVQSRREVKPEFDLRPQAPSTATAVGTAIGEAAAVAAGPLTASSMMGLPGAAALVSTVVRGMRKVTVSAGGTDGDVMPIVRIKPIYPARAAERDIEGWVLVRFNITAAGTVKDAVVVDSSPAFIFDDAAVQAVLRWKYNPKIESGVAVERRGIMVVLRFEMEKE